MPTSYSIDEIDSIQITLRASSILSCLGSISIIAGFCYYQKSRTAINYMIVYMSVCDFFGSISTVQGNSVAHIEILCDVQGFFVNYCLLAASFWTGAMATHPLIAIRKNKKISDLDYLFKYYHLVCWGLPLILTLSILILPLVIGNGRSIDISVFWCWISDPYSIFRFILFYGWIWAIYLYNISVYIIIGWKIKKLARDNPNNAIINYTTKKFMIKMAFYIVFHWLVYTPATINRFVQYVGGGKRPVEWMLLQAWFIPLQGFCNACIFYCLEIYSLNSMEGDENTLNSNEIKKINYK